MSEVRVHLCQISVLVLGVLLHPGSYKEVGLGRMYYIYRERENIRASLFCAVFQTSADKRQKAKDCMVTVCVCKHFSVESAWKNGRMSKCSREWGSL